jgi:hypothetical protein
MEIAIFRAGMPRKSNTTVFQHQGTVATAHYRTEFGLRFGCEGHWGDHLGSSELREALGRLRRTVSGLCGDSKRYSPSECAVNARSPETVTP